MSLQQSLLKMYTSITVHIFIIQLFNFLHATFLHLLCTQIQCEISSTVTFIYIGLMSVGVFYVYNIHIACYHILGSGKMHIMEQRCPHCRRLSKGCNEKMPISSDTDPLEVDFLKFL